MKTRRLLVTLFSALTLVAGGTGLVSQTHAQTATGYVTIQTPAPDTVVGPNFTVTGVITGVNPNDGSACQVTNYYAQDSTGVNIPLVHQTTQGNGQFSSQINLKATSSGQVVKAGNITLITDTGACATNSAVRLVYRLAPTGGVATGAGGAALR